MVAEEDSDADECLSSLAQPTRETSAKAATQGKIKVKGRREALMVFIIQEYVVNVPTPMGSRPHDHRTGFRRILRRMERETSKMSLALTDEFAAVVDGASFRPDIDYGGTGADHLPVIPGSDFYPKITTLKDDETLC
jgi:hypothetical protein